MRLAGLYKPSINKQLQLDLGMLVLPHVSDWPTFQVRFHPSTEHSMVSGSTDGLINVFDISQTAEGEALTSTYNTQATVVRGGKLGCTTV